VARSRHELTTAVARDCDRRLRSGSGPRPRGSVTEEDLIEAFPFAASDRESTDGLFKHGYGRSLGPTDLERRVAERFETVFDCAGEPRELPLMGRRVAVRL